MTERIVIASDGRFDRALDPRRRWGRGLPSRGIITHEEFLETTTVLRQLVPETASRVGHPATLPVALPTRPTELYT